MDATGGVLWQLQWARVLTQVQTLQLGHSQRGQAICLAAQVCNPLAVLLHQDALHGGGCAIDRIAVAALVKRHKWQRLSIGAGMLSRLECSAGGVGRIDHLGSTAEWGKPVSELAFVTAHAQ